VRDRAAGLVAGVPPRRHSLLRSPAATRTGIARGVRHSAGCGYPASRHRRWREAAGRFPAPRRGVPYAHSKQRDTGTAPGRSDRPGSREAVSARPHRTAAPGNAPGLSTKATCRRGRGGSIAARSRHARSRGRGGPRKALECRRRASPVQNSDLARGHDRPTQSLRRCPRRNRTGRGRH